MSEVLLRVDGICKQYPGFELHDVSFELPRGYIMGFVGPNGAGKTTTIRIITNLARASKGKVKIFGLDSREHESGIKRRIGYVPDNHDFYDAMTVAWTAGFVRQYYPTWDDDYFNALLDKFGVESRKKIGALSKGTRAKFALSLALAHRPELLILDEPTSGLDPVVRQEFLSELMRFVSDGERSVLFSSHISSDLERIADYVTIIVDGRIVETDEKDVLLERYAVPGRGASIDEILIAAVRGELGECGELRERGEGARC